MPLNHADMLKLKRWNAPTISNAIELLTTSNRLKLTNLEETCDFMPEMGPMVGSAVTLTISGGNPKAAKRHANNLGKFIDYLTGIAGPKIVVLQDIDKPACYGSFWGEVSAYMFRSLGCVGTITDGAIRDLDEMKSSGFKAIARRMAVGHAYCWPLTWGFEIVVFGTKIKSGEVIHADKHGFVRIPESAQDRLVKAARFFDDNECNTVLLGAQSASGKTLPKIIADLNADSAHFENNVQRNYPSVSEMKKRIAAIRTQKVFRK
jgi:4-hydroxy-4-methyl-2-oxoglutarate aldolase